MGLQGSVDVDKDDDYQVENSPNYSQHGQDGFLLTLLVLDSFFLITDGSVYHFPWKSLQISSQTSLERADKKKYNQSVYCIARFNFDDLSFYKRLCSRVKGAQTHISSMFESSVIKKWTNL